jgi:hypothetical protein
MPDSQYDEKAFTRYVHFRVLTIGQPSGKSATGFQNLGESEYCAKLLRCQSFERRAVHH